MNDYITINSGFLVIGSTWVPILGTTDGDRVDIDLARFDRIPPHTAYARKPEARPRKPAARTKQASAASDAAKRRWQRAEALAQRLRRMRNAN